MRPEHEAILVAIQLRDAQRACAAMSSHLGTMGKLLMDAVHQH